MSDREGHSTTTNIDDNSNDNDNDDNNMTMSKEEPIQIIQNKPLETVPSTESTENTTSNSNNNNSNSTATGMTTAGNTLMMTTNTTKTPPRSNNTTTPTAAASSSYAQDIHSTPIASIKRPRGQQSSSNRNLHRNTNSSTRSITGNEGELSPLHGVKTVQPAREYNPKNITASENNNINDESNNSNITNKQGGGSGSGSNNNVEEIIFSPDAHYLTGGQEGGGTLSDDDESMGHPEHNDEDEFNPWQFIQNLPPYNTVANLRPNITLPPKSSSPNKKTLVLDLDETLVHCSVDIVDKYDMTFPVCFHGINYTVYVQLRPHLKRFLSTVSKHFEVIVFTASQKVYADALLNLLDPDGKYIHHRLFRESCLCVENNFMKDLTVLGRDLSQTILVDNSPHAFGYQIDNGIPIESWFDNAADRELIKLEKLLLKIVHVDDVREFLRAKFANYEKVAAQQPTTTLPY